MLRNSTAAMDDILQDTVNLFGDSPADDGKIYYGPLVLTTAPKVRYTVRS